VLSFLSPEGLANARGVSRHFSHLIENDPILWRRHIPSQFQPTWLPNNNKDERSAQDSDPTEASVNKTWRQHYCQYIRTRHQVKVEKGVHSRIIDEIISTEHIYANSLRLCVENYFKPLQNCGDVLPNHILNSIFSNCEILSRCHGELSRRMNIAKEMCRLCPTQHGEELAHIISVLFEGLLPFLALTHQYSVNYTQASEAYNKAMQTYPKFVQFQEEAQKREGRCLMPVESYLIMPVRRIPRYSLLISDLIDHCPTDDKNLVKLQQLQARLQEYGTQINQALRSQDNNGNISQ